MLSAIGYIIIALGFTWILEAHFGFRVELSEYFYPFDTATRQMLGVTFIAAGSFAEWKKSRRADDMLCS